MSHAENLEWLAARGFQQIDAGHWANYPYPTTIGYYDLMQDSDGLWQAVHFDENASGPDWEGPRFDNPAAAWVHAELADWGQS